MISQFQTTVPVTKGALKQKKVEVDSDEELDSDDVDDSDGMLCYDYNVYFCAVWNEAAWVHVIMAVCKFIQIIL